ncbi:HNH endonuclease signature motif containing protein [Microbacterium sp. VKM Ac-2923]|uniref:HNH endonuclease signature motif containing protein n=1 Tax=Microbacterium sp. VKM Ac-2923 TaxID=2929476 RepID=UPI001FB3B4A0|nr:HNH endonuclease signature motif containing protein [Microbacterium sp. VKM Ac-2923]MCJ1707695.1 HNH endonuclease [Microbacterium sp. VKM Ac-2923]
MADSSPAEAQNVSDAERERLRDLVSQIRVSTLALTRVQASLIRHRAAVMGIALDQVARSGSRASQERELPVRPVALEIAAATHTHDLAVQRELNEAHTLTEKFCATVDALESGRIGMRHAQAILDTGAVIDDDDTRAGWEQVVLSRAERDSPGRTRAFARELAESVQPVGMTERHARAAATRGVSVRDLADGMAELSVILPATVAYGIRDRLRKQAAAIRAAGAGSADGRRPEQTGARAVDTGARESRKAETNPRHADTSASSLVDAGLPASTPGTASPAHEPGIAMPAPVRDDRTLNQIGADICADLLLTAAPTVDPTDDPSCPGGLGAIRAQVQITVPVLTLLGLSDVGAAVAGRSPIDPQTARRLAARAPGWDRVLCDPVVGTVLDVDRYSPTSAQRRYLAARDRHCRAPGCRAPLTRCQIDHNHEAQHGGGTTLSNLAHLCVRHHTLKTETEWTVSQDLDGNLRFESPLGQKVMETPPPRVLFIPDGVGDDIVPDPPPF